MRKKISAVLLLMLTFLSCPGLAAYEGEILFRGIPWGSNLDSVFEKMGVFDGDEVEITEITKENVTRALVCYSNRIASFGGHVLEDVVFCENGGFEYYTFFPDPLTFGTVAGHKVIAMKLQFIYDIQDGVVIADKDCAKLVSGKYTFSGENSKATYDDLIDKLIWLYGKPSMEYLEKPGEKYREGHVLWEGGNDTGVCLYVRYQPDDETHLGDLILEYGKTDIADDLEYINEYWEMRERDAKYNSENTDGL